MDPQLTFGNIGQGDSNVHFTSGVGARTGTDLLIFSGYLGPDPAGDGGGPNVESVWVQDFDAKSAASKGPAQLFFQGPNANPGNVGVLVASAAIAPSGEIALLYYDSFSESGWHLYAAFLEPGSDGGVAGLTVLKTVPLTTNYNPAGDLAHAIWSNAVQAFVFSWVGPNGVETIAKYTAVGAQTAGGVAAVATDDTGQTCTSCGGQSSVGESGGLLGIVWDSNDPMNPDALTVYDSLGDEVGGYVYLGGLNGAFTTLAGVASGFVSVYTNPGGPTKGVFLPTADGGVPDAGTTYTVPGVGATKLRAVSDGVGSGGAGGVGLALLYQGGNSASFAYIHADGTTVDGPVSLFSTGPQAQAEISLTNLNGSFVVTAFNQNGNNVSTQIAASGCN